MPCSDGYSSHGGIDHASAARADTNARVACNALRVLEDAMGVSFTQRTVSPETWDWWLAHKEADRRREVREKEQRELEIQRRDALKKLTPAERKALGL